MTSVFADTSFWAALLDERDAHHLSALAQKDVQPRFVTTEAVLNELLNLMNARAPKLLPAAIHLVRTLFARSDVEIVPSTRDLFLRGLDLIEARTDKRYRHTDWITSALTADAHFEQEGFLALLAN